MENGQKNIHKNTWNIFIMLLETHGLFPTNLSATSQRIERELIKSRHFVDAIKREVNNYGTKRTTLPRLRQLEDAISLTDQSELRYSIGALKDRSRELNSHVIIPRFIFVFLTSTTEHKARRPNEYQIEARLLCSLISHPVSHKRQNYPP